MIKVFAYIVIFCSLAFNSVAQQNGSIDNVAGTLIPKTKRQTVYVDGRPQTFYTDTAYTLILTIKTQNLALQDKIVLKLGLTQNDTTVFKKHLKFLDHGTPNKKCSHTDDITNKELDELKFDILQVKFEITNAEFSNLKWVSTCVMSGNNESQYKHYEFK